MEGRRRCLPRWSRLLSLAHRTWLCRCAFPRGGESSMMSSLLEKGKDQGYLLSDEIIDMFPNAEEQMDSLEEFYSALVAQGIEVLDQKPPVPEPARRTPERTRTQA